jgi:hypothetical protein
MTGKIISVFVILYVLVSYIDICSENVDLDRETQVAGMKLLGNAFCHSAPKLLPSHFISKNINIKIHKTVILPVVFYGCVCLTFMEEHKPRTFENRVPRKIFGLKRDEITGGWRKLHNVKLHNLQSSDAFRMIKPTRMRQTGHVAHMGTKKSAHRILVDKPEGKRPLHRDISAVRYLKLELLS